jgi:hypothetical protein
MATSKVKNIQVLSPDGITIDFGVSSYKGMKAAKAAFKEWANRYKAQGYYSSSKHGRINLLDLEDFCEFVEI